MPLSPHARVQADEPASVAGDEDYSMMLLRRALEEGVAADYSSADPAHNSLDRSGAWGAERTLAASDLAKLLLSKPKVGLSHAERVIIKGARISGHLDLGCGSLRPFMFHGCRFDLPLNLSDCDTSFVGFVGCELPGLSAERLKCSGPLLLEASDLPGRIVLDNARIDSLMAARLRISTPECAAISMVGVVVGHDVDLSGARLSTALLLARAEVGGDLNLSTAKLGVDEREHNAVSANALRVGGAVNLSRINAKGSVDFSDARIGGSVTAIEATVSNANDIAVSFNHAKVGLALLATKLEVSGGVSMHHAEIGCQLNLAHARIDHSDKEAIRADHVVVNGSIEIARARINGTFNLHSSVARCHVNMRGIFLDCGRSDSYGITLDHGRVEGSLDLMESSVVGGIDLRRAALCDEVLLGNSKWSRGDNRAPVLLDFGHFDGGIIASPNFTCDGLLAIQDAWVGQKVDLTDARIGRGVGKSFSGAGSTFQGGLVAERTTFKGTVDLIATIIGKDVRFADARFLGSELQGSSRGNPRDRHRGGRWRGKSVRLSSAGVAGDCDFRDVEFSESVDVSSVSANKLNFKGALFKKHDGLGLDASHINVRHLDLNFAEAPNGALLLDQATVEAMCDSEGSWNRSSRISIEGLKISETDAVLSLEQRLRWLARATPDYSPYVYERFAATYEASGMIGSAREVRYASLRRAFNEGSRWRRSWGVIQDCMVGYGYRPFRAACWALTIWLLGAVYFLLAPGVCDDIAAPGLCPVDITANPGWNPLLFSLDTLVPFVSLGQDNAWILSGVDQLVVVLLMGLGWVLLTTIATGVARSFFRS